MSEKTYWDDYEPDVLQQSATFHINQRIHSCLMLTETGCNTRKGE